MMKRTLASTGLALCFAVQPLTAATIDGTVGGGEYPETTVDGSDGTAQFVGTGLDMDSVGFDEAGGQFQVGVDTADTFDFDGDPTALPFNSFTRFVLGLESVSNPGNQYIVDLLFGNNSGNPALFNSNVFESTDGGASFTNVGTTGSPAVSDDLEFEVDLSLLPNLGTEFNFVAQLDGSGEFEDDQISGFIPEPTTAALIGLGGLALLRRRR